MSISEIERFSKDVASNESFREELKVFGTDSAAAVTFANAKGYDFSLEDVSHLAQSGELTDTQLNNVAGGGFINFKVR